MENQILNKIINIFNSTESKFYADTFEDIKLKNNVLLNVFDSQVIRDSIGLTDKAALKVAYVSKQNCDFMLLKESLKESDVNYNFAINYFPFSEEFDKNIFDLVIYDNLCLEDFNDDVFDFDNIDIPKIFLFNGDCDLKV